MALLSRPLTPLGIYGDLKLDHSEGVPTEAEEKSLRILKTKKFSSWRRLNQRREARLSIPERVSRRTWTRSLPQRRAALLSHLLFATRAPDAHVEQAEKVGRKILVEGRSMKGQPRDSEATRAYSR